MMFLKLDYGFAPLSLSTKAVAQRCSVKKAVPATLLKKRHWHRCFPANFAKFLRTPFFTEHLWWLLLSLFFFFFIFMRGRIRNFLHILLDTHIGLNPFHLNKKYRK